MKTCSFCHNNVTTGASISPLIDDDTVHCPYCLSVVEDRSSTPEQIKLAKEKRTSLRRRVRERYVARSKKGTAPGGFHCPVCDHPLNHNDETLLLNTECFRCHLCGHDLASAAYRQEAYRSERWQPLANAIKSVQADPKCAQCRFIGAASKACVLAFSWMPEQSAQRGQQLASLPSQTTWQTPDCELATCSVLKQYRKSAGEGLLLL